ncbi:bifunctional glutamate N-acetyltransferase/amino-acid acetyltransferase ArgJ [uncultured Subdoligranulum sp.]|uniref:bifunctional glutamate N-acetyltransferase/amino-acid acetyltransferase ArgJ n=1 Tax=uncultured Subdoligranulum sp. TaxID=512298 RepID=UPI0025E034FB|nr:bifunctional glutamate N-acetyltransferase/amino-acid acetyltransferase ArgJ [uncultured Subdoligranulum sp.]
MSTQTEFTALPGGICAPRGFAAAGVHCGIRRNQQKPDLALIRAEVRCAGAACYTTNKVYGAPITVDREHLADGYARAILVNSGNANTCAPGGLELARQTCRLAGEALGIPAEDVLPASTGVIGQPMTIEPFAAGIPAAAAALAATPAGSLAAATAIMTTDTHPKEYAVEFLLGGKPCRIGAIAKGSGMIHPNMATMLLFLTTDAAADPAVLQAALSRVVPATFNQISVDGDTSTNDTVMLLASGLAGAAPLAEGTDDYETFVAALTCVAEHMCRELAGDGEGATKLLECRVTGAPDLQTARAVAKSVIHSTLFKAAMFGADANWGRVLCAIGYTPGDFDVSRTSVRLQSDAGEVFVCENAALHPYSEEEAARVLAEREIRILVDLGDGEAAAKAWGCDLTYDYVKINGDYRT